MKPIRIHDDSGKFDLKGDEPRMVRSIRLTDTAWERLGTLATAKGITRADLLEQMVAEGSLSEDSGNARDSLLRLLAALETDLLSDVVLTRNGKDRGAVRRTIEAIRSHL